MPPVPILKEVTTVFATRVTLVMARTVPLMIIAKTLSLTMVNVLPMASVNPNSLALNARVRKATQEMDIIAQILMSVLSTHTIAVPMLNVKTVMVAMFAFAIKATLEMDLFAIRLIIVLM